MSAEQPKVGSERFWLFRLPEGHAERPWSVTTHATTAENARDAGWEVVEVESVEQPKVGSDGKRWRLIGQPPGNTPLVAGPEIADDEEVEVVPASEVERLEAAHHSALVAVMKSSGEVERLRAPLERLTALIADRMGSINFYMGPGARVAIGLDSVKWYRELQGALDEGRAALHPDEEQGDG
jgi:hypothetical protein